MGDPPPPPPSHLAGDPHGDCHSRLSPSPAGNSDPFQEEHIFLSPANGGSSQQEHASPLRNGDSCREEPALFSPGHSGSCQHRQHAFSPAHNESWQQHHAFPPGRHESCREHEDHAFPPVDNRQSCHENYVFPSFPAANLSATANANALEPSTNMADDSPPFWNRHGRTVSSVSYHSILQTRPAPIRLEDHSEDQHEQSQGCWAKSVTVDDYTVVSGPTGIGAYVVWLCTVSTLKGGNLNIRKRYSEFDHLRADLLNSFPNAAASIPELPRKSVVSRFRPKFLEHRKNGLNHFMNCVLLNPEFAASPVLKDFIFS